MCVVLLLIAALPGQSGRAAADPPASVAWRDIANCGPNCLYAMMSLHGLTVPYDRVREAIDVGPKGSTLDELRRAATALGMPSAVVRCKFEDLRPVLPVIIHQDFGGEYGGHYVLLLGDDQRAVYVMESLNGEVISVPRQQFFEVWSGVALVPAGSRGVTRGPAVVGAFGVALCLVTLCWPQGIRRGTAVIRRLAGRSSGAATRSGVAEGAAAGGGE